MRALTPRPATDGCGCRPSDRWCPAAKRMRETMRCAHLDFRHYRSVGDQVRAARALRAYDFAEKMLRGHLAKLASVRAVST